MFHSFLTKQPLRNLLAHRKDHFNRTVHTPTSCFLVCAYKGFPSFNSHRTSSLLKYHGTELACAVHRGTYIVVRFRVVPSESKQRIYAKKNTALEGTILGESVLGFVTFSGTSEEKGTSC